mmetsp:Transcript_26635/g.79880  ORF Transcript_26635/g.79880 Transcript_26635/m.79880 type:complete len:202 (+) Transcript_26635:158-763(+)
MQAMRRKLLLIAAARAIRTTTRRVALASPLPALASLCGRPRPAAALYATDTVNSAKESWDVADPKTSKNWLPYLDACCATLDELAAKYPEMKDGDAVRRYLGTVGVTSPLFKIRPALKSVLASDLPDAVDVAGLAEASEAFLAALQDADGDAYGAQFADYSTSVGKGGLSPAATQLATAEKDIKRARAAFAELLAALKPLR